MMATTVYRDRRVSFVSIRAVSRFSNRDREIVPTYNTHYTRDRYVLLIIIIYT